MLTALRGATTLTLVAASTVVHVAVLLAVAVIKFLLPLAAPRRWLTRCLIVIAESWIAFNSRLIDLATPTRFDVTGLEGLRYEGWYLVISNHQSWVDIPVLQKVFNRRIPFLKFFLKQQLIWVPLLGLAWWALDFPFMRRYSQALLARHPELRGKDIEITRRACERFRHVPVSVMNFVEGTRFTPAKQAVQGARYTHLLRPKAGGVAFVLGAMAGQLGALVDVSIVYPAGRPTVWQLFSGQIPGVRVCVTTRAIPPELVGDYENDAAFRARFQQWINGIWAEKDATVAALLAGPTSGRQHAT